MSHPSPDSARRCHHCNGFPVVALDTGTLNADGTRHTVKVTCPACHGTGATIRTLAARGRA